MELKSMFAGQARPRFRKILVFKNGQTKSTNTRKQTAW